MGLTHQMKQEGALYHLSLFGEIDEHSDFSKIELPAKGILTIDLKGITMLNSMGLRNWVQWSRGLRKLATVKLENCPNIIVHQINVLEGFIPLGATVESMDVPYFCDSCNAEFYYHAVRGTDYMEATQEKPLQINLPEPVPCPECGEDAGCDFIPNKHFHFLNRKRA
jgi:hypothetical protein